MKPNVVVDEMFPEGAGSYMDLDEVRPLELRYDVFVCFKKILTSANIFVFKKPGFKKLKNLHILIYLFTSSHYLLQFAILTYIKTNVTFQIVDSINKRFMEVEI